MANIRQRGNAWYVQIRLRGAKLNRTFDTRSDAEAWAQRQEETIISGFAIDRERAITAEVIANRDEIWAEHKRAGNVLAPFNGISKDDIYVISDNRGKIKVGRSIDPQKRIMSLQTGSTELLTLVLVVKHRGDDERRLHALLSRHRISGEWFHDRLETRLIIIHALRVNQKDAEAWANS